MEEAQEAPGEEVGDVGVGAEAGERHDRPIPGEAAEEEAAETEAVDPLGEDPLVWAKSARLMMTLPCDHLVELKQCISKILRNLIDHPGEEKYSVLKHNNAHLQQQLFRHCGGVEILYGVGFNWEVSVSATDGSQVKTLRLPSSYSLNWSPFVAQAELVLTWLQDTAKACQALLQPSSSFRSVAEVVVQIDLPANQCARGGFMLHDTLEDVLQFTRAFFLLPMRGDVQLRRSFTSESLGEPSTTLREAGFSSRERLLASTRSPQEAAAAIAQAHHRVQRHSAARQQTVVASKKQVADHRKDMEEQRRRTLQDFKDDRAPYGADGR